MKHVALTFCLAGLSLGASAARLYVCTGTIGADAITVVDDGRNLWAVKGTFDVTEGPGTLPKVRFGADSLNAQMSPGNTPPCTVSSTGGTDSIALTDNCSDTDANAKLTVNLASIGLVGADVPVACETVEVGRGRRAGQPQRGGGPRPGGQGDQGNGEGAPDGRGGYSDRPRGQ